MASYRSCCKESGDGAKTKLQDHQGGYAGAHHSQRPSHKEKVELPNESSGGSTLMTGCPLARCVIFITPAVGCGETNQERNTHVKWVPSTNERVFG